MKKYDTVERDISWMYFNHRILEEAQKDSVPVLERLFFLGIYSNNLDEFFRVRVANLNRLAACKDKVAQQEVEIAKKVLKQINQLNCMYVKEFEDTVEKVTKALAQEHILIIDDEQISTEQREVVKQYYRDNLIGRISAIWLDEIKHFDSEADDAIYMIIRACKDNKKPYYAIITLPVKTCGRWIRLPDVDDNHYIMYLDDVVRVCLPMVFPGMMFDSFEAYSFKFTRDAEMDIDNDMAESFMQKISKGVKSRKMGAPLRLVYDSKMPKGMLQRIKSRLNGDKKLDTSIAGGKYHNHCDMMRIPDCGRKDLKYRKWPSILSHDLHSEESVIHAIRKSDRFLHVPYHSFDGYIRLLNEAAINPKVKGIKTTIYRLAKDSKVVQALIYAAQNGKKVKVVMELLARFDEASNINWSKKMQDAGIEVVFGVEGLKVHSKITYINFHSGANIACISTGNFHEGNASAYTDILLMTARRNITTDVEKVFKFIERPYAPMKFKELIVSPNDMKKRLLSLIDKEISNLNSGKPAYIKVKINHITEPMVVQKLYEAARAGVNVELLVRGNCSLVDNDDFGGRLRVVGIIDRYLEHSRIYCFCNNGDEKVFIGSADWMPRNLDCRIEVVTPIYDERIKEECKRIVDYGLKDTKQGRCIIGEADYGFGDYFRSQEELYKYYKGLKVQKEDEKGTEQQEA